MIQGKAIKQDEISLVVSEDGSHTLFNKNLQEHYHSIHGAIQESSHIFINAGLNYVSKNNKAIRILEIGFGTGLNALLSCLAGMKADIQVQYHGIEAFPLDPAIASSLNYGSVSDSLQAKEIFAVMHNSEWNREIKISPDFTLLKTDTRLQDTELKASFYNLVYFDAFSPEVQSEMWTEEVFLKISASLENGGVLVTYCCKGTVKRALKSAGFSIEKLPGPPGKREILRATKVG